MKRIKLDNTVPDVKQFIRNLPVDPEGVELELDGRVLFKLIPPAQFSDAEKAALLKQGRELVRRARERNKGVPARLIEREVRKAVNTVRRKQQ
jgi:hypothetical protein